MVEYLRPIPPRRTDLPAHQRSKPYVLTTENGMPPGFDNPRSPFFVPEELHKYYPTAHALFARGVENYTFYRAKTSQTKLEELGLSRPNPASARDWTSIDPIVWDCHEAALARAREWADKDRPPAPKPACPVCGSVGEKITEARPAPGARLIRACLTCHDVAAEEWRTRHAREAIADGTRTRRDALREALGLIDSGADAAPAEEPRRRRGTRGR